MDLIFCFDNAWTTFGQKKFQALQDETRLPDAAVTSCVPEVLGTATFAAKDPTSEVVYRVVFSPK
ncbi:MAG: hypothetical protein U0441_32700 [Polyangiaceae bacterium]